MKFGVIAMKFSMRSDRNEIWSDRNQICGRSAFSRCLTTIWSDRNGQLE